MSDPNKELCDVVQSFFRICEKWAPTLISSAAKRLEGKSPDYVCRYVAVAVLELANEAQAKGLGDASS